MLFDVRRHPQAQRVYHTGMRLARKADTSLTTRHATANLVASTAYQAAWTSPRGHRIFRPPRRR